MLNFIPKVLTFKPTRHQAHQGNKNLERLGALVVIPYFDGSLPLTAVPWV
jgi:hypothetical protein